MSTYGRFFRVTTFGESHGAAVGCIVDGVPPAMRISLERDIQPQMDRRRPGQSSLTTQRSETDKVHIFSGTEEDPNTKEHLTLGTPLALIVYNQDQRKFDYATTQTVPRPGHADYSYEVKYGVHAASGGGRASARETASRVAAGALAEKWLSDLWGTEIVSWVSTVQDIEIPLLEALSLELTPPSRKEVDTWGTLGRLPNGNLVDWQNVVYDATSSLPLGKLAELYDENSEQSKMVESAIFTRCPHPATAVKIANRIKKLREEGDSTGGILTSVITAPPVGIGEPCFEKIEAELARGMMSLPAVKGFEIGEGFRSVRMTGSQHNDRFKTRDTVTGLLKTHTNHAGGSLGGISHGPPIVFRVAIKPVSSISLEQDTCSYDGKPSTLGVKGRHDPCVLPRAPPLTESMAALVIADLAMQQRARTCPRNPVSFKQQRIEDGTQMPVSFKRQRVEDGTQIS